MKSRVVSGFASLSGLVLMVGVFARVIGCPYSAQIRRTGFWLGAAMLAAFGIYSSYEIASHTKKIFNKARSQGYRLVKNPGSFITAVYFYKPRILAPPTIKCHGLRLPPDIFFSTGTLK